MKTLTEAMDMAAQCLVAWLDPQKDFMPTGGYEVAHDTGRWWDAMLRWEAATNNEIPKWAEKAMYSNIHKLMDNDAGFLSNRLDIPWMKDRTYFNPHNIREGMLALSGLVRFRGDDWAADKGHQMLMTLDSACRGDGSFDYAGIGKLLNLPVREIHKANVLDGTSMEGRALEPIIEFYELTDDALALKLAERIATRQLSVSTTDGGLIPERIISPDNQGHNHSYLGTLRGLLKYGILTNDSSFIKRVSDTYENSLFINNISHAGWAPHDLGMRRFNNEDGDPEGDPASCGDVVQLAMWLAEQTDRPNLLDDAERLIRARLLPQQLTDKSDPRRNGAWGIYRHPFGFGVILDVFAAVLHTLCDVHENIFRKDKKGNIYIDMAFDMVSPLADLKVTNGSCRLVQLTLKEKSDYCLRIPSWVDRNSIRLKIDGKPADVQFTGEYHILIKEGSVIEIRYDLPTSKTIEKMKISGREFKLTWKGDEVVSCTPKVPMYP